MNNGGVVVFLVVVAVGWAVVANLLARKKQAGGGLGSFSLPSLGHVPAPAVPLTNKPDAVAWAHKLVELQHDFPQFQQPVLALIGMLMTSDNPPAEVSASEPAVAPKLIVPAAPAPVAGAAA